MTESAPERHYCGTSAFPHTPREGCSEFATPVPAATPAPGEPGPLTSFPLCIVVFCDSCGLEVEHDYVVHDLMTRDQRLAVARTHLVRNEGWHCGPDGDFCPVHVPAAAGVRGPDLKESPDA